VGEERKPFAVHSTAVAATSDPFRALVNGNLVEANTRSAELKDVCPDDFVRFLEYAYRRDYSVPPPMTDHAYVTEHQHEAAAVDWPPPEERAPPIEVEDMPPPEDPFSIHFPAPVSRKKKKKRDVTVPPPVFDFQLRNYLEGGAPNALLIEEVQIKPNSAVHEDFTPVFLAHARLYSFADMRLVHPLKNLALHKLQKTLLAFQLYSERIGDIIKLVRYAYDHGLDRSEASGMDELRRLVVEYMASEVDAIGKHAEFKILLEEGGEFVTDFWGVVSSFWL
jgi:hypothetical protein